MSKIVGKLWISFKGVHNRAGVLPDLILVPDPLVSDPLAAEEHGTAAMLGQLVLQAAGAHVQPECRVSCKSSFYLSEAKQEPITFWIWDHIKYLHTDTEDNDIE